VDFYKALMKTNRRSKLPIILEVVGYSGAGKTTLIEKLIPALRKRGIRLAVIKHTSHHYELDKPGKDSHRLRMAGAEAVLVSSPKMVAMFREVEREWPIKRLLRHLPRHVDLVIAEGFRNSEYPCIEVYRRGVNADLKCRGRQNLLAVVGDDPGGLSVPHFHRDAVRAITEFLMRTLSLPRLTEIVESRLTFSIFSNANNQHNLNLMEKSYESHGCFAGRTRGFLCPIRLS
jgi:molybdopterin-guanine dinucleotide biosynthesis protein B